MTEERRENYFGMQYGQPPSDILSIRARFDDPDSAQTVFEAERYMREIAGGQRELGDEPEIFSDPIVLDFLTQGRPEFGGRSVLASLRSVIDQEKLRGFFIEAADIPQISSAQTPGEVIDVELIEVSPPDVPIKKIRNQPNRTRRSLLRGTSEGRDWVGIGHFLGIGVSHEVLNELLKKIPSRQTPWGSTSYTAYDRIAAENAIKVYMESHPRIPRESATVIFDDTEWTNSGYLEGRFGLSNSTVQRLLKDIPFKDGRGKPGREIRLYDLARAIEILEEYSSLPSTDPATGVLKESGTTWAPIVVALKRLNISYAAIADHLEHINFKSVRTRKGKIVKAYDESAIKLAISNLLSMPKVGDSRMHPDLVSGDFLAERFSLHRNTIHKKLKSIAKSVRGKNGKPSSYYMLSEAEALLKE